MVEQYPYEPLRSEYTFHFYQAMSALTAVYPDRGEVRGLAYLGLGLCGEAGEVAEKVKKAIRDHGGRIDEDRRKALSRELGDVLWYVAEIATHLGLDLGDVAANNTDKLLDRKDRGVLDGSGDDR